MPRDPARAAAAASPQETPYGAAPEGRAAAAELAAGSEESPGSTERRCRVTPGGGELRRTRRESATESRPPRLRPGKGERVRQERTAGLATGAARQTPPGARPNRGGIWAWFRLVARVGCLRGGATRPLEEWSPSHAFERDGQNPAYRPSGTFHRFGALAFAGSAHPKRREAMARQKRSDDWGFPRWRSYGDKGRRRPGCGCATARAATRPATGRRPRRRTAPSAGISAKRTPPNTTGTGIISQA